MLNTCDKSNQLCIDLLCNNNANQLYVYYYDYYYYELMEMTSFLFALFHS